ncbi:MAG: 50S ribosomal protein L11 methyltransferase [Defluviitaleaceae bacterium]|nr:50S ribosomal protein L11 methyltransferase [Defluviitaleaceae bacterium]
MSWLKVSIETSSENIEPVCGALLIIGLEAVEIDDPAENLRFLEHELNWDYLDEKLPTTGLPVVRFYLSPDENRWSEEDITRAVGSLGTVIFEKVEDNWANTWLEHYKPLKVGKNLVIRPFWENYDPAQSEVVFTIDPGHVFGTGQHQSTALCLQLLEEYVRRGDRLFDVGCGSGILGLTGILLGASHLTAVDIDPAAAKMVKINAEHNGINDAQYTALCGNILEDESLVSGTFNIVAANIVADVIIALTPIISRFIEKDGLFIVSGIIDDRVDDVTKALEIHGFKVEQTLEQEGWAAMSARCSNV